MKNSRTFAEEHAMNQMPNFMLESRAERLLAIGASVLIFMGISGTSLAQQPYVGAEYCAQCHPLDPSEADNYAD